MKTPLPRSLLLALLTLLGSATLAIANDVDGPNDCTRPSQDFGDAPDGIFAYPPGVMGLFPTCMALGTPAGFQTFVCPPNSMAPGAANGFLRHRNPAGAPGDWLGCFGGPLPSGSDSEPDGKVNLVGAGPSTCNGAIIVDNVEPSWFPFGQDEAYGDTDAGLAAPLVFSTCKSNTVTFRAYSCAAVARTVNLNILVDWNRDGDWNDNMECPAFPALACAYEWPIQNIAIVLNPGCNVITSPAFLAGPVPGEGWMRITISDTPAGPDFPWNGSAGLVGQTLQFGETEDYPVTFLAGPGSCTFGGYMDWGDAPESIPAYPGGIIGNFPTCFTAGGVAGLDIMCGIPIGPPPGPAGFVRHDVAASDPVKFWLGCPSAGFSGVDGESDGKVNIDPPMGVISACDPTVAVDGFQAAWLNFGQDETFGDADAGLPGPVNFLACDVESLVFRAFNCSDTPRDVFVNVLVDWNEDGDWTDNIACGKINKCAPEWAIRNIALPTNPGCNTVTTPKFRVGSRIGRGWLRVTITDSPVPDDFPWNGSISTPNHSFLRGETEDYPVRIEPSLIAVEDLKPGTLGFASPKPNPARNQTMLRWSQPAQAKVSLAIYDVVGRKVVALVDRDMEAGVHEFEWNFRNIDGNSVAPGVYLAKLRIGTKEFTTRVIRTH